MNLKRILSGRNVLTQHYWPIVWEWEDILAKELGLNLICSSHKLSYIWNLSRLSPSNYRDEMILNFDMGPKHRMDYQKLFKVTKGVIPCIIDYFLSDDELDVFVKTYKNARLVLISSAEVYHYLLRKGVDLPIEHFPLSLSDKYAIDCNHNVEKIYDIVLFGRTDPIFEGYLNLYLSSNSELNIVKRKIENGKFNYYDSNGNFVGDMSDRESYMKLTRKSKIFLYAPPGVNGEKPTNGFHQVTPRFLEGLAAGLHPIIHYIPNEDTEYYELDKFGPNVQSYQDFKEAMDKALSTPIDVNFYNEYLKRHYTSKRAELLNKILLEH